MARESAGAGVAAIEDRCILAATLLLPGLAALSPARAEEPPAEGVVSLKYGWYRDRQPGLQRVTVSSPQLHVLAPFAGQWSFEGARIADSVSGATPRIHTFRSSASAMADHRDATDVKVTRYFRRGAVAVGAAYSDENDYLSRTVSAEARWSTEDNNRTLTFGLARSQDKIDTSTTGGRAQGERKRVNEGVLGITQVLTPNDIVQLHFTRTAGSGYYTDPYKDLDNRPRSRSAHILLARWNHHVESRDATLRTSWRFYKDSFGIRSHTFGVEWVQPAGAWTVTPALRYYTQSAAWFYFDPVPPRSPVESESLRTRLFAATLRGFRSADHRLAAFGGVTASIKLSLALDEATSVDFKFEAYRQAGHLRPGRGSPMLQPLDAKFVQAGISHRF